ncbi:hypothetical protein RF55_17977 [Lasius niger]|uniref:Uncharacterized protein n=1 Tax=Lasius niger TaxID=67767 RepID=A0A0J7MUZ6_LASNI|nr:hypothetical protein RF55_17977 [Lasius niger]
MLNKVAKVRLTLLETQIENAPEEQILIHQVQKISVSNKRKLSGDTNLNEDDNDDDCDSLKELCRYSKPRHSPLARDKRPQIPSTSGEASVGSTTSTGKVPKFKSVAKYVSSGPQGRKKMMKMLERMPTSEESGEETATSASKKLRADSAKKNRKAVRRTDQAKG